MSAIAVGLVGAGSWAEMFHDPMIAAGPETRLSAVWARRPEAAQKLAAAHGAEATPSLDALLHRCDAVVFAVPPDVQAELAPRAAARGRALLLEKPLGLTLDQAERLARGGRPACSSAPLAGARHPEFSHQGGGRAAT